MVVVVVVVVVVVLVGMLLAVGVLHRPPLDRLRELSRYRYKE